MRILIADDDPVARRVLEGALVRLGHEVIAVADGDQALAALLAPNGPRLAILDWMMPGTDGLEVCRRVRDRAPYYIYVIILTSRDRHEDTVACYDAEADEFLTKPLDVVDLRARLRSGERVLALQERLLEIQEALRHEAACDHLTGLWNRRMILEQLGHELHRAAREKRTLAVAIADLDHFKQVNDLNGHSVGDAVLRAASDRMRSVLRNYEFMGRYGGEEFLIILPGCESSTALGIAERVRRVVSAEPLEVGQKRMHVSVSVGVAWTSTPTDDPSALIHAADQALYRAKAGGRDRVEGQGQT
jgi:two-component system cell cycle response regulator